ncbi:MAG TPA: GntR family transcriptional regulator [Albitalea sp.]|uniref:GntR family transcriptional regulator n=1 Tax=Piscinibacter sp. TaxID=1903157 RepID=UPI002ED51188
MPAHKHTPWTPAKRRTSAAPPAPTGLVVRSAIFDRILQAVMEHRLPPGTKLVEDRLAELFDTSRAQVRDVLTRLTDEGVVTTIPNRGAFIASPTPDETREVFEARRLIEPALVRRFIEQGDGLALVGLRTLVEQEEQARARQDRPVMVRLSGEFHLRLAESAGNRMLERSMRALTLLSSLAIFLYDAPHATACREDEHRSLLAAIERRRADRAAALMLEHLDHIEASLDLRPAHDAPVDLAAALMPR